ncbi:MAG: hypothetical protein WDO13_12615 [Verrucomicrobiota bacterium]
MQNAGDVQQTTLDFWMPKIQPVSVHVQSNGTGGTGVKSSNTGKQQPHLAAQRPADELAMMRRPSARPRLGAHPRLWALVLLGMAIFGVVEVVELSIDHTSHEERALDAPRPGPHRRGPRHQPAVPARRSHPGAIALGRAPVPRQHLQRGRAAQHQLRTAEQAQGDLENLFTQWGLPVNDANHVADCLYDWVTPGTSRASTAPRPPTTSRPACPSGPPTRPSTPWTRSRWFMGFNLVEKVRPNWQDSFTIWSSGPLNVNEAAPELIAAIFSLDPKQVAMSPKARNGRDGIPAPPTMRRSIAPTSS